MRNIIFLIGFISFTVSICAQNFTFQESTDLNSDGETDKINLEIIEGTSSEFVLNVNDIQYKDVHHNEEILGFKIVDININDKYKEIIIAHTSGGEDDSKYLIFWYDKKNIIKMEDLGGWANFTGNGIVYVNNWENFWTRVDKYVLNDITRTLKFIPQFAYYVGIKAKVVNSFSIFRNKDLKEPVALLNKDSEIELLLCDNVGPDWKNYLYLIKSISGLTGWAKWEDIQNNVIGIKYAD